MGSASLKSALCAVGSLLAVASVPAAAQPVENGSSASATAARIGPSFDCAKAHDPLAQLICSDPGLSRTDLLFVQAYQALRQQVGEAGQKGLRQEAVSFQQQVVKQCVMPISDPLPADLGSMRACVEQAYQKQRSLWLSRLALPASEEARRPIEDQISLQRDLRSLGFLPATAVIDGVYGPITRAAISTWQTARGLPATGLLADHDAAALVEAGSGNETTSTPSSVKDLVAPGPPMETGTGEPATGSASGALAPATDWYNYTRHGDCIPSSMPASPNDLVSFDRLNGLVDDVLVMKRDSAGKSLVVRVGEPEGNSMETVYMFFRGKDECETYRKSQEDKMNDLN